MANFESSIKINESDAISSIGAVDEAFNKLGETGKKASKKLNESFKKVSKKMKAVNKTVGDTMRKAFVKLGKQVKKTGAAINKTLKNVSKNALKASKTLGKAGLAGALVGVGASVLAFKKILDDGKALQRMAMNTGIAIDKLEEFRVMTALMGGNMDNLGDAVQDFTEKMGEASADAESSWADAFSKIGVTLTQDVAPAIDDTLKALAKMVDEGKKSEAFFVGVDLFGDAFKETFASMISEGIEPFEAKLKDLQKLKAFDAGIIKMQQRFRESMNTLKVQFGGFLINGMSDILPRITALVKTAMSTALRGLGLSDADIVNEGGKFGKKFGEGIDKAMTTIFGTDGIIQDFQNLFFDVQVMFEKASSKFKEVFNKENMKANGEIFKLNLQLGFENGVALLRGALGDFINTLGQTRLFKGLSGRGDALKESTDNAVALREEIQTITESKWVDKELSGKILAIEKARTKALERTKQIESDYINFKKEEIALGKEALAIELAPIQGPQPFKLPAFKGGGPLTEQIEDTSELETAETKKNALINIAQQTVTGITSVWANAQSLREQRDQKEISDFRKKEEAKLSGLIVSNKRRLQIESKMNLEVEKKEKELAEKRKKAQIANVWINTAAGIAGAWGQDVAKMGTAGLITAAITSAALTANAFIQTGTISEQSFATGGVVQGNSFNGDNVRANVNSGEVVLNQGQIGKAQALFDRIDSGTVNNNNTNSSAININIEGNATDESIDRLKDDLRELKQNGFSFA